MAQWTDLEYRASSATTIGELRNIVLDLVKKTRTEIDNLKRQPNVK
jgi:hypothetical protein